MVASLKEVGSLPSWIFWNGLRGIHVNLSLNVFLQKMSLGFWWRLHWHCRLLWMVWTFWLYWVSNSWIQDVFPLICVFLNFSNTVDFSVEVSLFPWLSLFLSIFIFYHVNFLFRFFISRVLTYNWFFCVDLVHCWFVKFVY